MFSWPSITESFWVARVFLYWSLSFSIFSLISSTIDQLLEWVPTPGDDTLSERDCEAALSLLICPRALFAASGTDLAQDLKLYRPKWSMVYVWQCPVMLMSWSWILFYTGFLLSILTPVIPDASQPHETQVRSSLCAETVPQCVPN